MAKPEILDIVRDTREQRPLTFDHLRERVKLHDQALKVYDYALLGDLGWGIEFKCRTDFFTSFTTNKGIDAEAKKLEKANNLFGKDAPKIYVVSCELSSLELPDLYERRKIGHEYAITMISHAIYRLGIIVLWCGDIRRSEHMVYKLLKQRKLRLESEQNPL